MKSLRVIAPAFTLLIAAATTFSARKSHAAEEAAFGFADRPANAVAGECWCRYSIPARYKTVSELVMVEAAQCSFETLPAVYEPRIEKVCVRKESSRRIEIPAEYRSENYQALLTPETCRFEKIAAVYEDRDERVCVRPESQRKISMPATYKTENYDVCVSPARTEWRKRDCDGQPIDTAVDAKDVRGECFCLVNIPGKFETRTKQVMVEAERCAMETVPAEFKIVSRKVCVSPESSRRISVPATYETRARQVCVKAPTCTSEIIPAEYKTVEKQVCVKEASKRQVQIPAKFQTRTREVLVSPATTAWRKTSCEAPKESAMLGD